MHTGELTYVTVHCRIEIVLEDTAHRLSLRKGHCSANVTVNDALNSPTILNALNSPATILNALNSPTHILVRFSPIIKGSRAFTGQNPRTLGYRRLAYVYVLHIKTQIM